MWYYSLFYCSQTEFLTGHNFLVFYFVFLVQKNTIRTASSDGTCESFDGACITDCAVYCGSVRRECSSGACTRRRGRGRNLLFSHPPVLSAPSALQLECPRINRWWLMGGKRHGTATLFCSPNVAPIIELVIICNWPEYRVVVYSGCRMAGSQESLFREHGRARITCWMLFCTVAFCLLCGGECNQKRLLFLFREICICFSSTFSFFCRHHQPLSTLTFSKHSVE